jgi:hypothetical protein
MKFLVTWKIFETITQEQAKPLRGGFGQQLDQQFDSPKIKDVGIFGDARGGYMILDDVNSANEISEIMGPEILDNSYIESHPIASVEGTGELFRQWAEQGR